jgi:hypothetical protein
VQLSSNFTSFHSIVPVFSVSHEKSGFPVENVAVCGTRMGECISERVKESAGSHKYGYEFYTQYPRGFANKLPASNDSPNEMLDFSRPTDNL